MTSIRECPICGQKLDKGYIIPFRGMKWDTEKHKFWHVAQPWLIRTFQNAPALRCKQCEIVIFDWEEYVSSATPKSFLKKCVRCGKEIPIAELQCQYCGSKQ